MPAQVPGTREALLDAALQAFAERGYGSTTMTDVRRAAGASTGSLYHHFPTREHLAAAVWLGGLGRFQRGFADVITKSNDAEQGVKAGVRFHLRWVREHPELARMLLADQDPAVRRAAEPQLDELNQQFFGVVREWHGRHVADGTLRALPFDLIHALWLGPAQELARLWLAGATRRSLERSAKDLADGAWAALRAPSGAPR
jgi:AcrR family transcriptional regulator